MTTYRDISHVILDDNGSYFKFKRVIDQLCLEQGITVNELYSNLVDTYGLDITREKFKRQIRHRTLKDKTLMFISWYLNVNPNTLAKIMLKSAKLTDLPQK